MTLSVVLAVVGTICVAGIVVVFVPRPWLVCAHEKLGLGPVPSSDLLEYFCRSIFGLFAVFGGAFWVAACRPRRYAPMLVVISLGWLVLGAAMLSFAITKDMPFLLYAACDATSAIAVAVIILALVAKLPKDVH
jgi:hypothetical protein